MPDWRFRNYLYSHFHVADDFIIDGKLYSRQGASYPVRVITLNGRKLQADETESPSEVEKVDSWDRVYEKLKGELSDVDTETGRGNLLSAGSEGAETGGAGTAEGRGRGAVVQTGVLETAEGERVEERPEVGGREHSGAAERSGDTGSGELEGRQLSSAVRPDVSDLHERHDVRQLEEDRDVLRGERTGSDRAGDGGDGRVSGRHRSGIGAVRADRGSDTVLPVKAGKQISALHSVYVPASGAPELGTVIPNYMAEPIARALTGVRERHGDIDEYVMSELGYGSKEELYNAFGAEQVDGLALAIDSLQRGGSFIIGDQTGVGKGRQCAGLMRWAQKNGRIPVFFTAKSMLMTDMYYDGKDIGTDFQPLILGDVSEASVISRENGERIIRATEKKKIGKEGVKLLDNDGTYNALWLPYSQVNTRDNEQQLFIRELLNRQECLIVMDEAHSAAGADSNLGAFFRGDIEDEGSRKRKKKKKGDEEGKEKKPGILESAPVVYVSATFAKRPENMPLYYKTKLSAAVKNVTN